MFDFDQIVSPNAILNVVSPYKSVSFIIYHFFKVNHKPEFRTSNDSTFEDK